MERSAKVLGGLGTWMKLQSRERLTGFCEVRSKAWIFSSILGVSFPRTLCELFKESSFNDEELGSHQLFLSQISLVLERYA